MKPVLVIFVKEPHPGRVKTRLGRDIGPVGAAWWFRHQTRSLIRRVGRDPRWRTILSVSPDAEGMASRVWPPHLARMAQGGGDLGRRMVHALNRASAGGQAAMVIGADIPGVTPGAIARGFRALRAADAVIGPSPDGGFWLIGRAPGAAWPRALLSGARWSSEHARADTLSCLAPRRVALVDTLCDIDQLEDLRHLGQPLPASDARR